MGRRFGNSVTSGRSLALLLLLLILQPAAGRAQLSAAPDSELILQPGDLIRVTVWREPDLGGDFLINTGGTIVLPLIGERRVVGVPFNEVRDTLLAEYQVQLRNTSITILPLRRVYVLGEVARPGLLTVDPTITLAGVLALAGGATPNGDIRKIRIVRDNQVLTEAAPTHLALASADVRSGDQIFVERRNWFERNTTFIVSALLSVTSIIITVLR